MEARNHDYTYCSSILTSSVSINDSSTLFSACRSRNAPTARRISAISIAERVAEEQCLASSSSSSQSSNNAGVGSLVGYQVRLESASSRDTQLLFLTPGVLLRKLQSSPMLSEYTHIIIDEVHERDKYTEFLMIRLRDLLPLRPDLRLVLMSATLQTEVLLNYFAPSVENGSSTTNNAFYLEHPPVMLSIEGRTFPVQEFFVSRNCCCFLKCQKIHCSKHIRPTHIGFLV